MRVVQTGKNMVLSPSLEHYLAEKFGRLDRYDPRLDRAMVEITPETTKDVQNHYVVQANLIGDGRLILRGEQRAADPFVAIDTLAGILARRLERRHDKMVRQNQLVRGRNQLPPAPAVAFGPDSTLDTVLADFGINDATIQLLKAHGIWSMEQLRAAVDRNQLAPRLGPGHDRQARRLAIVVEQLR